MQKLTRFLERPDLSHCITELGFHIMVAHLDVDVCCQLRSQHYQQKINTEPFFFFFGGRLTSFALCFEISVLKQVTIDHNHSENNSLELVFSENG